MEKRKWLWLFGEAVFVVATAIVMIFAYFHKEDTFAIFTTYVVVAAILGFSLTVYWQSSKKRNQAQTRVRLTQFAEHLSAPTVLWERDLQFLYFNDALRAMLGLAKDEIVDAALLAKLFGESQMSETLITELLGDQQVDAQFSAPDGATYDVLWTTSVLEQENRECYYLSVGIDITELRQMQKELEEYSERLARSESRYSLSMELSEIGILLREQGQEHYYVSEVLQRMLGLESRMVSMMDFRRKVHPNDLVIYDTYVSSMDKLMESTEQMTHMMELRIRSADGAYRWYTYRYKASRLTKSDAPVIGGALFDMSKEKEKDALIERLAYVDEVTGISNRNKLMIMGNEIYNCCLELGVTYWVIVLDIDRFHLINDTCGYESGNRLLRDFAHILYKYLSFGGFGARISGDNFAMIIRDYGDEELPLKTLECIQADFDKLTTDDFSAKAMTCSAGFCRMPRDGDCFEKVLEHAEFAFSSAQKRKGSVVGYSSSMHDTIITESQVEKQLAEAIDNGELCLYYQPKISLANGRIIGVEALIRWIQPDGTIVEPSGFVPIAETSHLISRISSFVLTEACEQNRIWQRLGLPNIVMSINLTSTDFYQSNVRDVVHEALARSGLDPQWLEVELTETLALQDIDLAVDQMNQLRSMGVKLAMDDFGTGYSSLSYIQLLPITLLKLDRSFIINLEHDEIAREIVSAIIRIAKSKHIETIAEGIEHPEQARLLRVAGCDNAQGYLYGKPMPPKEIEEFMRRNITERIVY